MAIVPDLSGNLPAGAPNGGDPHYAAPNDLAVDTGIAVTPSDTLDFTQGPTVGIIVGVAGNLAVLMADNTAVTIPVIAGTMYNIRARRIKSTGTTATSIVAFF